MQIWAKITQMSEKLKELKRCLAMFFWFYKIPPPKMTISTFYNISSSLLILSASKVFLVRQKYIWFEKQKFFWWETKNDKKIWIWKVENPKRWYLTILGDFQFFKFNLFVSFLVSHWKNIFLSESKHTFVLPKPFYGW